MDQARFKIVFEKLSEEPAQKASEEPTLKTVENMRVELEEIAELRRIILEITEPESASYTTT